MRPELLLPPPLTAQEPPEPEKPLRTTEPPPEPRPPRPRPRWAPAPPPSELPPRALAPKVPPLPPLPPPPLLLCTISAKSIWGQGACEAPYSPRAAPSGVPPTETPLGVVRASQQPAGEGRWPSGTQSPSPKSSSQPAAGMISPSSGPGFEEHYSQPSNPSPEKALGPHQCSRNSGTLQTSWRKTRPQYQ